MRAEGPRGVIINNDLSTFMGQHTSRLLGRGSESRRDENVNARSRMLHGEVVYA